MITCQRETKKARPLDQEDRETVEAVEREEPQGKVLGHNQGGNGALKNNRGNRIHRGGYHKHRVNPPISTVSEPGDGISSDGAAPVKEAERPVGPNKKVARNTPCRLNQPEKAGWHGGGGFTKIKTRLYSLRQVIK